MGSREFWLAERPMPMRESVREVLVEQRRLLVVDRETLIIMSMNVSPEREAYVRAQRRIEEMHGEIEALNSILGYYR